MSPNPRLNLFLALVLGLLIGLHWFLPKDATLRNWRFFPDMATSMAYESQAPAPLSATGERLDLRPPTGSIAQGYLPIDYQATPEDAIRAGLELVSPIADDDLTAMSRGGEVFANFCAICHGPGGHGDGAATKKGVPPPPSLFAEKAMKLADGQMFHILTFGQANMASYASQIDRIDRWRVIKFVNGMQEQAAKDAAKLAKEQSAATDGADESAVEPAPEPAVDNSSEEKPEA